MSDRPTIAHRQGRYNTTVTSNLTILQTEFISWLSCGSLHLEPGDVVLA